MEPGRTVFGRYEITGPLPDIGELERHAARDTHSGDEVEVIRPSALAALRPGARDRFRDAWDSAVGDRLPAARLPALATGDVDGRPTAVRPRVDGPWSPNMRLTPEQTLAVAGWLLPALTGSPPPGGVLSLEDVVLDPEGIPRIAPTGIVPRGGLAPPPLHDPPEVEHSDVDRARYGLGVLLFRASTGTWPFEPTPDRDKLRARQRTPSEPTDSASNLPEAVAHLLSTLVSPDAAIRARAAVPPPRTAPVVARPAAQPRPPKAESSPVSSPRATSLRRDEALAPFAIVLDLDHPDATRGARARLAALLDRPPDAFELPAQAPRQVLVAQARTEDEARERMAALSSSGAPLSITPTEAPAAATMALMLGALVAIVGGGAAVALSGVLAMLAVVLGGGAAAAWGLSQSRAASLAADSLRRTDAFARRGPQAAPALADGATQVHLQARAQAARKSVLLADLADAPRVDLLASIDELADVPAAASSEVIDAHLAGLDDIQAAAVELSSARDSEDVLSRARRAVAAARATRQAR